MKTKSLLSILFLLMISAISFGQGIKAPSEGKAVIYIINVMSGFDETKIYDGETIIDVLEDLDYIRYECDPGAHLFLALNSTGKEFFTSEFEANKIYIIRMRIAVAGIYSGTPIFEYFDSSLEVEAAKSLKIITDNPPNESGAGVLSELQDKFEKRVGKVMRRYETKLKKKRKFIHLSKEMTYQE